MPSARPRPSITAALGLALTAALAGGCAKRLNLTPSELDRVKTEAEVNPLRVYPSQKLIAVYDEQDAAEQFKVQGKIVEASDSKRLKDVTTKNTEGLILKIEELNGKPLLWVVFDSSCRETKCAFGFVETEDKLYRLITVPKQDGFKEPKSYRFCVWKKRRLRPGKLASLAEANDVFLVKKNNGKILTIDLQVKKVVDDRTRTRTRRQRGVDSP